MEERNTGPEDGLRPGWQPDGIVPRRRRLRRSLEGSVKLAGLSGHDLARRVQCVAEFPAGALVRLLVEPGQQPPVIALDYLARHGNHLGKLVIECSDPDTAVEWHRALDQPPEAGPW